MPADVRRRVDRDIRWMRLSLLSAVAVTVIFGGGTAAWALVGGDAGIAVLAPASTTTAAFLQFSIARRIAARRGSWRPPSCTRPFPRSCSHAAFTARSARRRRMSGAILPHGGSSGPSQHSWRWWPFGPGERWDTSSRSCASYGTVSEGHHLSSMRAPDPALRGACRAPQVHPGEAQSDTPIGIARTTGGVYRLEGFDDQCNGSRRLDLCASGGKRR